MSAIKYAAAKAIVDQMIADEVKFTNQLKALARPPSQESEYPTIVLLPQAFKTVWWYPDEMLDANGDPIMLDSTTALVEVGELEGVMRFVIAERYETDRDEWEDLVLAAFNKTEAPGALLATISNVKVGAFTTGYNADIAAALAEADWQEELAFSERRGSILDIDVEIPILVARTDAAAIIDLQVAISTDITTDISGAADPAAVITLLPDTESYQIAEDGTITAL